MMNRLDFASELARDAGKLAHSAFGQSVTTLKGRHDVVTAMDGEVERFIRAAIAARYPDDVAGMVLLDAQPADAFTALPAYPGFYATFRTVATLSPSLARIGLLGPLLGLSANESTVAAARGGRDEFLALPSVLTQSSALTSLGDRPLIVVTAAAEADPGWVAAQDNLPRLSTASVHRVLAAATHNSLISGVDAAASSQAILDVLTSIRSGTPLRQG